MIGAEKPDAEADLCKRYQEALQKAKCVAIWFLHELQTDEKSAPACE